MLPVLDCICTGAIGVHCTRVCKKRTSLHFAELCSASLQTSKADCEAKRTLVFRLQSSGGVFRFCRVIGCLKLTATAVFACSNLLLLFSSAVSELTLALSSAVNCTQIQKLNFVLILSPPMQGLATILQIPGITSDWIAAFILKLSIPLICRKCSSEIPSRIWPSLVADNAANMLSLSMHKRVIKTMSSAERCLLEPTACPNGRHYIS